MRWQLSHRADSIALPIADRHYNRQKIGSPQFVPPGRCVTLVIPEAAVWVTSWPFAEYVKHAWPGAWINSLFRNERPDLYLSSSLILEAVSATRFYWSPPELGLITFVDRDLTRPKRDPGRCYRKAGFRQVGETKGGLVALQLLPNEMPPSAAPIGANLSLDAALRGGA